jgi:multidrug resistance efflux pump
MPKSSTTATEKATAALEAAETRLAKKTAQHETSKALTERLAAEVEDAKATRDYVAKHPALQDVDADASVDQGDVKDDGADEDPFA